LAAGWASLLHRGRNRDGDIAIHLGWRRYMRSFWRTQRAIVSASLTDGAMLGAEELTGSKAGKKFRPLQTCAPGR
jgi:hypothetical protein